jgi:hypothetical protein
MTGAPRPGIPDGDEMIPQPLLKAALLAAAVLCAPVLSPAALAAPMMGPPLKLDGKAQAQVVT